MNTLVHGSISNSELLNQYIQGDVSKTRAIEERLKRVLKRDYQFYTLTKLRSKISSHFQGAEYAIKDLYHNCYEDWGDLAYLFKKYALND